MKHFVLMIAVVALGCGKSESSQPATSEPPPPSASPTTPSTGGNAKDKARELFIARCVPCHGSTGSGDGPASATLDPKPRAFHDPTWQQSVTDDHIMKIIKFGGAAVGKSAAMPNNPDLNDPDVVIGLKDIVRSFGTKP